MNRPINGVGFVFQKPVLFDWYKVLSNILVPVDLAGLKKKDYVDKAHDLIRLVKLEGFEDKYPAELSGGMQQRVSIARALILGPDILIMDELFGALDALTRDQLNLELLEIWREKTQEFIRYALGLFPENASIPGHHVKEIWWPQGDIPGIETSGLDWHNTLKEITETIDKFVIIPTSATEQHSPSQPLGTDFLQALELSRRLAEKLNAHLLPTLPILTFWGHIRFRGTLTFDTMTARQVIEDITDSLYAGGFKKAVLVNIHGGNWVIKPTLIEINQRYRDFKIISTGDILGYRGQLPVEQLHACESEASFIKAHDPDCLKADRVVDYSPKCPASAFDLVGIGGVSPQGVWGYPSKATAEKGRKDLEKKVSEAVAYIEKIF